MSNYGTHDSERGLHPWGDNGKVCGTLPLFGVLSEAPKQPELEWGDFLSILVGDP